MEAVKISRSTIGLRKQVNQPTLDPNGWAWEQFCVLPLPYTMLFHTYMHYIYILRFTKITPI